MKNLILLLALTLSVTVNAQDPAPKVLRAHIEFPTGYDAKADSMTHAKSGEKTLCNDGMVYRYDSEFTPSDLLSVLQECDEFLENNNLDFDLPSRWESTTYIDSDRSLLHLSFIELMNGSYSYQAWNLKNSKGEKYRVFLLLDDNRLEFSIDNNPWADK